jgi:hypothetical protein
VPATSKCLCACRANAPPPPQHGPCLPHRRACVSAALTRGPCNLASPPAARTCLLHGPTHCTEPPTAQTHWPHEPYLLSLTEQSFLNKCIKRAVRQRIYPTLEVTTGIAILLGRKKLGIRPTQDYQYINEWTKNNTYPLPLITELIDQLRGAKYFSKFDVRWAIITYTLRTEINGRSPSKQTEAFSNQWLCFLASAICQQPSKP